MVIKGSSASTPIPLLTRNDVGQQRREKQAYAVLKGIRFFRVYLAGYPFRIITDHMALRALRTMKSATNRIASWQLELEGYQYEIIHKPGKTHVVPDALSRPPIIRVLSSLASSSPPPSSPSPEIPSTSPTSPTTQPNAQHPTSSPTTSTTTTIPSLPEIQALQQQDPILNTYITYLATGHVDSPSQLRHLVRPHEFTLIEGTLYNLYHSEGSTQPRTRLVVPPALRAPVLTAHHDNILTGHRGIAATYHRIRKNYFWRNMFADVVAWCRSCQVCAHRKISHRGPSRGLSCIPPKDRPFEMIAMDILGPLPPTPRGNRYLLIFNDYATRFMVATPLKNATGNEVAENLLQHIILEFGPPAALLSDRGTHFLNEVIYALLELFTIYQVTSSGYRPQTAGLTERINATVADGLASYCNSHQTNWDSLIKFIQFQYRHHYNATIGASPFFLLYGYEVPLPSDLYIIPEDLNLTLADRQRNSVARHFNEARQHAKATIQSRQQAVEQRFDTRHPTVHTFDVGSYVMAIKPHIPSGGIAKLSSQIYDGPYRVLRILPSSRTYQLSHACTGEIRYAHVDNLKAFHYSEDLRPGSTPPLQPPTPSPEAEQRSITFLTRALRSAIHTLGPARVRATIHHVMGPLELPPLPTTTSLPPTPAPDRSSAVHPASTDGSAASNSFLPIILPPRVPHYQPVASSSAPPAPAPHSAPATDGSLPTSSLVPPPPPTTASPIPTPSTTPSPSLAPTPSPPPAPDAETPSPTIQIVVPTPPAPPVPSPRTSPSASQRRRSPPTTPSPPRRTRYGREPRVNTRYR